MKNVSILVELCVPQQITQEKTSPEIEIKIVMPTYKK
jgi:hypothetical protein